MKMKDEDDIAVARLFVLQSVAGDFRDFARNGKKQKNAGSEAYIYDCRV